MASTFLDIKGRNLVLSGDLTVNGTTTTIESTVVTIADPLMKLGDGNTANIVDLGVYAEQDTGTTATYSGYFKDASDDKFKFYKDLQVEPGTTVNTAGTGYTAATIVVDAVETTNINVDVTNGTINTSSGALTLSAASNANVLLDPAGTGLIVFNSTATNNGYSFPADAGPAQDGFTLLYNDATDSMVLTDPSSFAGADHVRSDATLTTAGAIVIVESATADRDVVESGIIIDGSDNITGVVSITATGTVTTSTLTSTGTITVSTASNGDVVLDPNGTGHIKMNNCLTYHGANNTTSDACDLGWFGVRDPTGSLDLYTGIFRDASDGGKYKIFDSLQVQPTGDVVNTAGTGFSLATLAVNALEAGNINIDVTNGTIDTVSGTLTISAATNNNVIVDPAGTGVINFYSAYSFPPADGTANYVMKTDGSGTITWVDPATIVGTDHVTASAVFASANKLIISENGSDREVVETAITITGGNTITGVTSITAAQILPTCATLAANTTLTATSATIEAVTTGATAKTITLPSAPACGTTFKIIKADAGAGTVIISRGGTDTLTDGATTSMTLADQYDQTTLWYEDTTGVWYIL